MSAACVWSAFAGTARGLERKVLIAWYPFWDLLRHGPIRLRVTQNEI